MSRLRKGLTTGFCAAAAAKAATTALLGGELLAEVELPTRDGQLHRVAISDHRLQDGQASCSVTKDAGDDPDVTNGMKVFATVSRRTDGIEIDGGEGIGRVTKPGLKVAVGEAAINPVPRQMIEAAIRQACQELGYSGGIRAVISMPGGELVAERTMNARLGVIGGLSILGTSGIVEPMSDQALVDTIKAEIDVTLASGQDGLLMMPGNYGRDFARDELKLDVQQAVRFSNFVGEALDHAVAAGARSITLVGHAGKLVKLAGGIMNTHSRQADCRMEIIAAHSALLGADPGLIRRIMSAVSTEAAIDLLDEAGLNEAVWSSIGERIAFHLGQRTGGRIDMQVIVFTQEHGVLLRTALAARETAQKTAQKTVDKTDERQK